MLTSAIGLDQTLLVDLHNMLTQHNPHVQTFQTAGERLRREPGLNLSICISGDLRVGRQYAASSADEVAVLIVDNPREEATTRDVALFPPNGPITRINETNSLYDPLHYVLMFPYAETGWREGLTLSGRELSSAAPNQQRHGRQNIVSVRQFYAYRLHERVNCYLHLYGRLWHQFIVDMFSKVEQRRMHYYRTHQRQLRVDVYSGMTDALQQDVADNTMDLARNLGRRVILPSSHTGSPRYVCFQAIKSSMIIIL